MTESATPASSERAPLTPQNHGSADNQSAPAPAQDPNPSLDDDSDDDEDVLELPHAREIVKMDIEDRHFARVCTSRRRDREVGDEADVVEGADQRVGGAEDGRDPGLVILAQEHDQKARRVEVAQAELGDHARRLGDVDVERRGGLACPVSKIDNRGPGSATRLRRGQIRTAFAPGSVDDRARGPDASSPKN